MSSGRTFLYGIVSGILPQLSSAGEHLALQPDWISGLAQPAQKFCHIPIFQWYNYY